MIISRFASIALAIATTGSALAFVPIGPFSGVLSEGFEGLHNYQTSPYVSTPIMGGAATLSTSNQTHGLWVIEPAAGASWGLGGNGMAFPHSGIKAMGLFNGDNSRFIELKFSVPMIDFGGYFATVNLTFPDVPLHVAMFDGSGSFVGSDTIHTSGPGYVWKGWNHAAGIKTVVFRGNFAPVMDDLQANPVPEPATMALVGLGAVAALRRRRAR